MTRVRLARADELDAVGELTADAYVRDGFADEGYATLLRDARTRAEIGELLVADEDGRLAGTATLVPPTAPEHWRETDRVGAAAIRMLAVAPGARGRGIGRRLAATCLERARAHGWPEIVLVTQPRMHAAHRIYEALGFVRDPALDRWVSPELKLIGYARNLDEPDS